MGGELRQGRALRPPPGARAPVSAPDAAPPRLAAVAVRLRDHFLRPVAQQRALVGRRALQGVPFPAARLPRSAGDPPGARPGLLDGLLPHPPPSAHVTSTGVTRVALGSTAA